MSIRKRASGTWELKVGSKLLPKGVGYWSFNSEAEALEFQARLKTLLAAGVVPESIADAQTLDLRTSHGREVDLSATLLLRRYAKVAAPATAALLGALALEPQFVRLRFSQIDYAWVKNWVAGLKKDGRLAPGSIRKKVYAFAGAWDEHARENNISTGNPFRLLPKGFANYDRGSSVARFDSSRDKRLPPDAEANIHAALDGVRFKDRQRTIKETPEAGREFRVLFDLIVNTGIRLREAFTMSTKQVDLAARTISVKTSKRKRGQSESMRQIPIPPKLLPVLADWCEARVGLLFSYWDGSADTLDHATAKLSRQFARLFQYVGVEDFTEHDLRHEACCRWVEFRHPNGGWLFSEPELVKIMGWTSSAQLQRYLSLRGSDLAARFG